MKNNIKKKAGFTLIETIIYVGIIGLVLSSLVSFSVVISNSRNKNYVAGEVHASARIVLDLISQKIKEAENINVGASTLNSDPGLLSLSMSDISKDPTIIKLNQDDGILQIKEGSGDEVDITTDEIKITNLVFSNLNSTSPRENVKIDITIEFNNQGDSVEFDYSKSYQTAVSLRH